LSSPPELRGTKRETFKGLVSPVVETSVGEGGLFNICVRELLYVKEIM